MSEERDVGSFVRRRGQVEEEVVVAEHVRSTRVVSVKFVDHPDQPRPVTTWQDHLIYTSHAPPASSARLMPIEARGNYLPEPPYLRETTTYHSQPLESIRHAGNYFVPLSIRPTFIFFVADVMSNYLTTDGLKNNLYIRRPPEA